MNDRGTLASENVLSGRGLCKSFGETKVLTNVSMEVGSGEIVALMGVNGAGKSTLLNIIGGSLLPDRGEVEIEGRLARFHGPSDALAAGVVMVHQELHLAPELSVAENLFLGRERTVGGGWLDWGRTDRDAQMVLDRLGTDIHPRTRVSKLSVAQQQMVEVARALAQNARLLILDEPTASLSETDADRLLQVVRDLSATGVGVIYTSHRLDEVRSVANRYCVLRDGVVVRSCPAEELSRDALICEMTGESSTSASLARARSDAEASARPLVLETRGVSQTASDGRQVLSDVSISVGRGEILGIAGLMGSGRTELLNALSGASQDDWSGDVDLEGRAYRPQFPRDAIAAGVAHVTEDRKDSGLVLSLGVGDNISLASLETLTQLGWLNRRAQEQLAQASIDQLDVRTSGPRQEVSRLSGGNQQKVVLAKWLAVQPRLLLLDEPTRGVDVGAQASIYRMLHQLADEGLAVVLVSSDWSELMAHADRIVVLSGGRVTGELAPCDYSQARLLDLASQSQGAMAEPTRESAA